MISSMKAVYRKNRKSFMYYHPLLLIFNRLLSSTFTVLGVFFINKMFVEIGIIKTSVDMSINEYLDFAFIGVVFYGYAISIIMNISRYLITEMYQGTITSLFISPHHLFGVFLGIYLEQIVRSMLEFMVLFFIIFILSPTVHSFGLSNLLAGILFMNLAGLAIGFLLSGIMLLCRETFVLQNTLIIILGIISGVVFPVQYFPKTLYLLSEKLPITIALNIVREGEPGVQQILTFLFGIFCIVGIGYILFKFIESKYIEVLVE